MPYKDSEKQRDWLEKYRQSGAHKRYAKQYYLDNKERFKENRRRCWLKQYDMTPEQYDNMLEQQKGVCAICKTSSFGKKGVKNFSVDHDHKTGKVRGLLCHNCNALLGHAKDDVAVLSSALGYLGKQS